MLGYFELECNHACDWKNMEHICFKCKGSDYKPIKKVFTPIFAKLKKISKLNVFN